jgi:hypothetical protein
MGIELAKGKIPVEGSGSRPIRLYDSTGDHPLTTHLTSALNTGTQFRISITRDYLFSVIRPLGRIAILE